MRLQPLVLALTTHATFHFLEHRTLAIPTTILLLGPVLTLIWSQGSMPSTSQTIWFYAQYLGYLILSIAGYRISPLHPLSSFPGPTLGKITKLYGVWISWTGKQHLVIHDLHKRFGSFVRIGPNDISVVEEEAVHSVLGVGGVSKGRYYQLAADPNVPSTLFMLTGEAHANRRRVWNRGFSNDSLKEYETDIAERATQLGEHLYKRHDKAVDLEKLLSFFTMDFMGDMAFGGGFETLRGIGDGEIVYKAMQRFTRQGSTMAHVPWAAPPFVQRLPLISSDLIKFRGFAASKALNRIQSTSVKKDLWYHLSDEANLEKQKPTLEEVVADGGLAIIAGADTTAHAMSALFFLLFSHPKIYEKLQGEIDHVYPTDANPFDTNKHDEMPYLKACLNETLRLYPALPTNGPREVETNKGRVIAGRFVPPRTQIYIPPYSLHRDPRYFSEPNTFIPERWLGLSKEPTAFIPFSYGPANCAGRNLAKREMMMVLSFLLQNFHFSSAPGVDLSKWPDQIGDHLVCSRGELWAIIRRRNA